MNASINPWPSAQHCCVLVTVNLDGESVDLQHVERENLYGRFLYGRYAMRAGLWRLLDVIDSAGIKATFFTPAADAESYPEQVEAVLARGHEVAARGYAFEDHSALADQELEILTRAHEALLRVTGHPPRGWRAPKGLLSPRTLGHLAGLGYLYDSSFQDDDYPYVMRCGNGGAIVELPTFQMLDDSTVYGAHHTSGRLLKIWKEEFAAMYAERGLVTLTIHARGDIGSGRASRAAVLAEFLAHVAAQPGVFFMTCAEMAQWWKDNHSQTELEPQ